MREHVLEQRAKNVLAITVRNGMHQGAFLVQGRFESKGVFRANKAIRIPFIRASGTHNKATSQDQEEAMIRVAEVAYELLSTGR